MPRKNMMEENELKNMNCLKTSGENCLRGEARESSIGQTSLNGSSGSLPSLFSVESEKWTSSEEFKEMLEVKVKDKESDVKKLEEENAELRERLEFVSRRNSVELERRKFQDLESDVSKLQAKIFKMTKSGDDLKKTGRLVTILEAFKSQLPMLDTSSVSSCDSVLDSDSGDSQDRSLGSCRVPHRNTRDEKLSAGSYRAQCHDTELDPPLERGDTWLGAPGRADTCVAQFSKAMAGRETVRISDDRNYGVPAPVASITGRMQLNRSRVVMGARTVHSRAIYSGSGRGRSVRAFSSSDLLAEEREGREEGDVFEEKTPVSMNRSIQARSKSHSHMLSRGDDIQTTAVVDLRGAGPESSKYPYYSCQELKDKKRKEETRVQKFFKRIKRLVSNKEEKVDDEEEKKVSKKMTRSLSYTIEKTKNLPKRLKSFHESSARLR